MSTTSEALFATLEQRLKSNIEDNVRLVATVDELRSELVDLRADREQAAKVVEQLRAELDAERRLAEAQDAELRGLREKLRGLAVEAASARQDARDWEGGCSDAVKELAEVTRQRDALRAYAQDFGMHRDNCRGEYKKRPCDCGLADALASIPAPDAAPREPWLHGRPRPDSPAAVIAEAVRTGHATTSDGRIEVSIPKKDARCPVCDDATLMAVAERVRDAVMEAIPACDSCIGGQVRVGQSLDLAALVKAP